MILGIAVGIVIGWFVFSLFMLMNGEPLPVIMLAVAGLAAIIGSIYMENLYGRYWLQELIGAR